MHLKLNPFSQLVLNPAVTHLANINLTISTSQTGKALSTILTTIPMTKPVFLEPVLKASTLLTFGIPSPDTNTFMPQERSSKRARCATSSFSISSMSTPSYTFKDETLRKPLGLRFQIRDECRKKGEGLFFPFIITLAFKDIQ